MTYSIVYSSKTGNTALLAQTIRTALLQGQCVFCGAPEPGAAEADLIFAGFWTDKGTCSPDMAEFLGSLAGKRVFLFGTAGFGGAAAYFQQILDRVAANLGQGNTLVGSYMCQGKMPATVRARYEAMAQTEPEKAAPMLENFDRAATHPDAADLQHLVTAVTALSL